MAKKLKVDKSFIPCSVLPEDELYPNGIFVFNITKMIKYIKENLDAIILEEVTVITALLQFHYNCL